jgi:hypothetical protein
MCGRVLCASLEQNVWYAECPCACRSPPSPGPLILRLICHFITFASRFFASFIPVAPSVIVDLCFITPLVTTFRVVADDTREQCSNAVRRAAVALPVHDVLPRLDSRSLRNACVVRPDLEGRSGCDTYIVQTSKIGKMQLLFSSTGSSVKRARTHFLLVCSLITTFFIQQFGAQL